MRKKILIISRAFPPMGGGGVQRIVKFSVYLNQLGWDVTVCATKGDNFSWVDESRTKELDNIKIIRVEERPYKATFLNKSLNKLRFEDFYNSWASDVVEYFKDKKEFDYNYVLTSGPPHSVHNIGLKLKKKFSFILVTDFRDPFTLGPTYKPLTKLHRKLHQKREQEIYDSSDLVITNTEINRQESLNNFRIEPASKISSLYNGYDFADLKLCGIQPEFSDDRINLLYLGGLRGDHIDGYFYNMLQKVIKKAPYLKKNIVIQLVGDLSRKGTLIESLKLEKLFKDHGAVSFDKVGDYIVAADGCLTWQHPNIAYKGTIAGKVFDYFGLKKPIFSLGQANSELSTIINDHMIGKHTDVNDLDKSADDFILFIKNLKKYKTNYEYLESGYYDSFNRKDQVSKLSEILINAER